MKSYVIIGTWTCLLMFASCKKKSSPPATTTPTTNTTTTPAAFDINHDPAVTYTLDGTSFFSYTEGVNGVGGGTDVEKNINSSSGPVTSTAIYSSSLYKDTISYFSVRRGTFSYSGTEPDTALFKQYFVTGNLNYSAGPLAGIVVQHWDASGKLWSTELGTANQTGSLFTIVTSREYAPLSQYMKVYATFNCKLYDGSGNSKTLTNGKFVGYFEND